MALFADIILPLPLLKRTFTYAIPEDMESSISPGIRVEVPFGNRKLYAGIIEKIHQNVPDYRVKPIAAILDEVAILSSRQLEFWQWMAQYYACTLGEVMAAALPGYLKLGSETKLMGNPEFGDDFSELDNDEYLLAEALQFQPEISIELAQKILNKKAILPIVQRLILKKVVFIREELIEKFKPRVIIAVRLAPAYSQGLGDLKPIFESLAKTEKQEELLLAFLMLHRTGQPVLRTELLQKAGTSLAVLHGLVKKGILEYYEKEISRLSDAAFDDQTKDGLSDFQAKALGEIEAAFKEKNTVLLQGVTGSGKTQVYMELIRKTLAEGGQVLYMLPEIALTTHLTARFQKVFGASVIVYHSKINQNERVEIWRQILAGRPFVVGARSALFLPFENLKLIIVDEEHDNSFKQVDPAPRYHARDAAVFLAAQHKAKVLLGSATPSLESSYNAKTHKYALVTMMQRYGGLDLPAVEAIELKPFYLAKQMKSVFSPPLLQRIQDTISRGEQVILFQNRRGFSPFMMCQVCGWSAQCKHCDVSLTYHKKFNKLKCHYCGYQIEPIVVCPACNSSKIVLEGTGTEKIEEEIKLYLPTVRTARMDQDTAGSKGNLTALLQQFEEKEIDVLIGTQMVTKGLDFDNVGLVGIVGADQLMKYPDFRSSERAFQLMVQVAGRAGRKHKQGHVLIQTFQPKHPIIQEVIHGNFEAFYQREIKERQQFNYPPFTRLIHLSIRHKKAERMQEAAGILSRLLRQSLGERVLGPSVPSIPRVRGYFHLEMLLKIEKSAPILEKVKAMLLKEVEKLTALPGFSQLQIIIDVDPS